MDKSNVTNKRKNVAGLISGNLKRHLTSKHQIYADKYFGDGLLIFANPKCITCGMHKEALTSEMERLHI